jgi:hypothetical protein
MKEEEPQDLAAFMKELQYGIGQETISLAEKHYAILDPRRAEFIFKCFPDRAAIDERDVSELKALQKQLAVAVAWHEAMGGRAELVSKFKGLSARVRRSIEERS